MTMTRRQLLHTGGATSLAFAMSGAFGPWLSLAHAADEKFEVTHTEAEWRKLLTPDQFAVLRQEGTERPYASPLNKEHRPGKFACAGCQLDAFSSSTKFDSGTGWPSFYAPLKNAVIEHKDSTFGMIRTAIACRRCGGHLGHVFDDGPKPTGLRYCMNGVALKFNPGAA
jgi:peptide-methionine (R)-S-oxide reductase